MTASGRLALVSCLALAVAASACHRRPAPRPRPPVVEEEPAPEPVGALFDLAADALDGEHVELDRYRGKVVLVVNVASRCGYTPQYEGLQELQDTYGSRGLVVMGFPSNEFGGQEPGSPLEIQAFCSQEYGVTFPMFAKIRTQPGPQQSPVYDFLAEQTGEVPSWNFCKYLVGRDGKPVRFWRSSTAPWDGELVQALEELL